MRVIGGAALDIYPSLKGLSSRLQQADGQFTTAGKRAGQKYGDAASKEAGGRLKTGLSGVFKEVAAPAAGFIAGAGIVAGFKGIIGAASDAQQSVGGVQAVFKQYANQVVADSRKADQALGLSATQYQQLATVTGALLKNQGLDDYVSQTRKVIQVGADLAAQYGGSTKDAVEALSSALRGETDPIERYGISLNQSAIQAELLNRGQSKLKGAALLTASAQARLAIITRQSADAQGQFAAQSDTLAERQQRLAAQFANQRAELGQKLLPAISNVTGFLNDSAIPALNGTVSAVGGLPPEVKAATAAFIAFRIAQSTGLTDKASSGLDRAKASLSGVASSLRDVTERYRQNREAQIDLTATSQQYSPALGRVRSSLNALKPAAASAGTALRNGLGGAVSLLGGPWGVAFAGAAVVATKFFQNQQEAKQRVDDLTASLNKQTGAVTQASRETAFKSLQDSGAIDAAKKLGINLEQVRDAALGNKDALASVSAELAQYGSTEQATIGRSGTGRAITEQTEAVRNLRGALGDSNSELSQARSNVADYAAFMGKSATETDKAAGSNRQAAGSYQTLAQQVGSARSEVRKLLNVENERRKANLQDRRDAIALREAFREAEAAAKKSKGGGISGGSRTADANQTILLDFADQFNNSTAKVRNAKGQYAEVRSEFLKLADQLGVTDRKAKRLADQLLALPRRKALDVDSRGMDAALSKLRAIKSLAGTQHVNLSTVAHQNRFATGGLIGGIGTGTSDSNLALVSRGEFMQRKAAVDYYGLDFMHAVNNRTLPKFAEGGPVGGGTATTAVLGGPLEMSAVLRLDSDSTGTLYGVAKRVVGDDRAKLHAARRNAAGGVGKPGR